MRHVRKYTRHTCGSWRVVAGRRRCCMRPKGHNGYHEWQKYIDREEHQQKIEEQK